MGICVSVCAYRSEVNLRGCDSVTILLVSETGPLMALELLQQLDWLIHESRESSGLRLPGAGITSTATTHGLLLTFWDQTQGCIFMQQALYLGSSHPSALSFTECFNGYKKEECNIKIWPLLLGRCLRR